jgi:hypothetical protein
VTIDNTIFLKEFHRENEQLNDLIELSNKVHTNKKELIDRDINFLKYGLEGEGNVYYELKNSFIPMICLHDIRLEYGDYVAQFDFIIITKKFIYVLETKKLSGDIEITSDGDFIRIIKNNSGKFVKKEGMYSPITQNERHVKILHEVLTKEELIKTLPVKSAVIMANTKTIVNKIKASKQLQKNIYKYDQVVNLLKKELNDEKNDKNLLEKYMYEIANFLIKNNKPIKIDYISKYLLTSNDFLENMNNTGANIIKNSEKNINIELYESLKKYRLETSKSEGVKPYFIFNNEELDVLIQYKPKNKEELLQIKGFGQKKVEKYGYNILSIIKKTL